VLLGIVVKFRLRISFTTEFGLFEIVKTDEMLRIAPDRISRYAGPKSRDHQLQLRGSSISA